MSFATAAAYEARAAQNRARARVQWEADQAAAITRRRMGIERHRSWCRGRGFVYGLDAGEIRRDEHEARRKLYAEARMVAARLRVGAR